MLTKLAVTLDQSPVVITGWPLLFIHTTPGLRQMGLMSSRAQLFWTLIYLEQRHCFWENVSCRLSKNKTHLNSLKKKKEYELSSGWTGAPVASSLAVVLHNHECGFSSHRTQVPECSLSACGISALEHRVSNSWKHSLESKWSTCSTITLEYGLHSGAMHTLGCKCTSCGK